MLSLPFVLFGVYVMRGIMYSCFAVLLAGCGSTITIEPNASHAMTIAEARDTCRSWMTEEEIDTLFIIVRSTQDAGVTFTANVNTVVSACDTMDCITCGTAVVDAIYNR